MFRFIVYEVLINLFHNMFKAVSNETSLSILSALFFQQQLFEYVSPSLLKATLNYYLFAFINITNMKLYIFV